jgi:tetratricopeptide (TPR) repeat protein
MSKGVSRSRKAPQKPPLEPRPAADEKTAPEAPLTKERQIALYEKAMKLFHAGELAKAVDAFELVLGGPSKEIAQAARLHQAACRNRLASRELVLPSPNDHYDYAVALMNQRELDRALEHLQQALAAAQNGDHIHYALALCYGLKGDLDRASAHLRRAIELNPRNRTTARNDPDFQPLLGRAGIRELLEAERKDPG